MNLLYNIFHIKVYFGKVSKKIEKMSLKIVKLLRKIVFILLDMVKFFESIKECQNKMTRVGSCGDTKIYLPEQLAL